MQHIAEILAQCADLLTRLDPEVIYPEPMADEWPATQPVIYTPGVDIEVGDE